MIIFNTMISELATSFPNSGGANGYIRHSFGLLPSFICGVFEFVGISINNAYAVLLWCTYMCTAFDLYEPDGAYSSTAIVYLSALLYFTFFITYACSRGQTFWNINLGLMSMAVAILLVGMVGAMALGNFGRNASNWNAVIAYDDDISQRRLQSTSVRGATGLPTSAPSVYPSSVWFMGLYQMGFYKSLTNNYYNFLGLEFASFFACETISAETAIPFNLAMATTAQYILFIPTVFSAVSILGLSALGSSFPLAESLSTFLPLSKQVVYGIASIGPLCVCMANFYLSSRIVFHLSRKGFMPEVFSRLHQETPYIAYFTASAIGPCLVALIAKVSNEDLQNVMFTLLTSSMAVLGVFISAAFIKLRISCPALDRPFRSPFGLIGGTFVLTSFVLIFLFSCLRNVSNIPTIFIVLVTCVSVWSIYYYLVTKRYIVLDADEKKSIVSSLDIDSILHTEHGYSYIESHCNAEVNAEILHCLIGTRNFIQQTEMTKSVNRADFLHFVNTYIDASADLQVNIPDNLRKRILKISYDDSNLESIKFTHSHVTPLIMLENELVGLLNSDILPRWKANEHVVERFLNNQPPMVCKAVRVASHYTEIPQQQC